MGLILVVDDQVNITNMMKKTIESLGHSCQTANNGKDCLEMIRKKMYDLVLLDLAMPEVTGVDVLRKLKEENILKQNKIVLFSSSPGFSADEIKKDGLEEGIVDRLVKPAFKKDLAALFERYLN